MEKQTMNTDKYCQIDSIPFDNKINDYDNIAGVYDKVMGDDVAQILSKAASVFIKKKTNKAKIRLLDLACGSGAYIYHFNKHFNAQSVGIDSSAGQLKVAKQKCVNLDVKFIHGNILDTTFPESLDIVTINLDALNHLTMISDWSRLFLKIYDSLNDDGLFLFDINSRKRLLHDWNYPEVILKKDLTYVQCGLKPTIESNIVRRRILMLIYQEIHDEIRKYSAIIEQVSTYKKDVYQMLKQASFKKVLEYHKCHQANQEHIFFKNRYFLCAYR